MKSRGTTIKCIGWMVISLGFANDVSGDSGNNIRGEISIQGLCSFGDVPSSGLVVPVSESGSGGSAGDVYRLQLPVSLSCNRQGSRIVLSDSTSVVNAIPANTTIQDQPAPGGSHCSGVNSSWEREITPKHSTDVQRFDLDLCLQLTQSLVAGSYSRQYTLTIEVPTLPSELDQAVDTSGTGEAGAVAEDTDDDAEDMEDDAEDTDDDADNLPEPKRKVFSMAVLGDSIAAGSLSDTDRGATYQADLQLRLESGNRIIISDLGLSGDDPSVFISHLNSVFSGQDINDINVSSLVVDNDTLAQSAADYRVQGPFSSAAEYSHATKLGLGGGSVSNLAVSGYKIGNIRSQIANSTSPINTNQFDYIIIEAGANDFCSNSFNIDQFRSDYDTVLRQLYDKPNKPTILVVPIPDINRLYEITDGEKTAFDIDGEGTYTYSIFGVSVRASVPFTKRVQCRDIRGDSGLYADILLCPFFRSYNSAEGEARMTSINDTIEDLTNEIDKDNRIFFAAGVKNPGLIQDNALAADCFHPNRTGQKSLSDAAWMSVEDIFDLE